MSRRRGYVITVHSLKRDVRSHELTNVADVTPDQAPKRASIAPLQFRSSAAQHSAPYQTHHPVSSARLPPRRLLSSIAVVDRRFSATSSQSNIRYRCLRQPWSRGVPRAARADNAPSTAAISLLSPLGAILAIKDGCDAIAFLDADNYYLSDHLTGLAEAARVTGAD